MHSPTGSVSSQYSDHDLNAFTTNNTNTHSSSSSNGGPTSVAKLTPKQQQKSLNKKAQQLLFNANTTNTNNSNNSNNAVVVTNSPEQLSSSSSTTSNSSNYNATPQMTANNFAYDSSVSPHHTQLAQNASSSLLLNKIQQFTYNNAANNAKASYFNEYEQASLAKNSIDLNNNNENSLSPNHNDMDNGDTTAANSTGDYYSNANSNTNATSDQMMCSKKLNTTNATTNTKKYSPSSQTYPTTSIMSKQHKAKMQSLNLSRTLNNIYDQNGLSVNANSGGLTLAIDSGMGRAMHSNFFYVFVLAFALILCMYMTK